MQQLRGNSEYVIDETVQNNNGEKGYEGVELKDEEGLEVPLNEPAEMREKALRVERAIMERG